MMSATLGNVDFFRRDLTARTGRETSLITSVQRPVPLEYAYSEIPLSQLFGAAKTMLRREKAAAAPS